MLYKLSYPGETQIISAPQDSISRKYGELDGYKFCGEREIIIIGLDPT